MELRVDAKWSVEYDPENNDRPIQILRYDEGKGVDMDNFTLALFYALLEAREAHDVLGRLSEVLGKYHDD